MSGNISEVSASLSSNSDIVSDRDVVPPRLLSPPPPIPQPKVLGAHIVGIGHHSNDDDVTEIDTISQRKENEDETIKNTFVVATLIATITFAAGFTLPGGTIQDGEHKGSPILQHNLTFQAFVLTDCIAMVLSASAVLIYLFTTVDEVRKNKKRYISYGVVATRLTMLAMVSMMIAFLAGTYAVLGVGDSNSIVVVTLLIGLSFFLVLGILVWKVVKYTTEY